MAAVMYEQSYELDLIDLVDLTGRFNLADDNGEHLLPCRTHDPELWFAEKPAQVEYAKALCVGCPVQQMCLAGARDRSEPWGVWGGELFERGHVIARKRPRGRPRKHPLPESA